MFKIHNLSKTHAKPYLKQTTIVIPRVDPLLESWRRSSIEVSEPHLAVEEAEDMVFVDVVRDGVDGGPRRLLEKTLGEALEGSLVHLVDLVDILLTNVAVDVDHERLHRIRYEVWVVTGVL